jgi:DNA modification methylase
VTVYYADEQVTLHQGDCIEVLQSIPEHSVDAIVTDPPYGISFMGKQWDQPGEFGSASRRGGGPNRRRGDHDAALNAGTYDLSRPAMQNFQRWCTAWGSAGLRVLKPGGHLLAFGGSRTWHRLATGIEDAGFEVRDSIAWLYGSGFPKSLDVSKAIDKAAVAEREVIGTTSAGRSSLQRVSRVEHGYRDNLTQVDPGAIEVTAPATAAARQWQGWGTALKPAFEPIVVARKPICGTVAANVLAHGTGALNIDACRIEATDTQLAEKYASVQNAGARTNTVYGKDDRDRAGSAPHKGGRWPTNVLLDEHQAVELDRGGASRFFPTFRYTAKAAGTERPSADGVQHPTVKPLELMRWLIRLVTPPDGIVLDPFAGSGTTGEAAIHEHKHAVLIEREPTYLPLIVARLSKPMAIGFDFEAPA